jgi:hypothetical protein
MSEHPFAEHYERIETRLSKLADQLGLLVPPETHHLYEVFLSAGEYGLALEVATEALANVDKVPVNLAQELVEIGQSMSMKTSALDALASREGRREPRNPIDSASN